jgi:hypothetical protein
MAMQKDSHIEVTVASGHHHISRLGSNVLQMSRDDSSNVPLTP